MAGWAQSHGAEPSVQTLCNRIINAQKDEINIMQTWLRDRGQPVPEAKPVPMKMMMDGMEHEMLMPGMLTDDQLKQLDAARGSEFDKLFLKGMIQHHQGAVSMVEDLLSHDGAAQDELVFKLTNDIHVDQITEIARMQRMLALITLDRLGALSRAPELDRITALPPVRHRSRSCFSRRISPPSRRSRRAASRSSPSPRFRRHVRTPRPRPAAARCNRAG